MSLTQEDLDFLKTYKPSDYEKPSVTVDMLVFTVNELGKLQLMLIKRKNPPYKNKWAIPGGFLDLTKNENLIQAADRELKEETGMSAFLEMFNVYSDVDRDPRMRVISVAYLALLSDFREMQAGDDAKEVKLFDINYTNGILIFNEAIELAFDHEKIIKDGIEYLRKTLPYSMLAFKLVPQEFTMYDLQKVYEAILDKKLTKPNFRRSFINNYVNNEIVEETDEYSKKYQRPAKLYRLKRSI